jgi:hypothetical protein
MTKWKGNAYRNVYNQLGKSAQRQGYLNSDLINFITDSGVITLGCTSHNMAANGPIQLKIHGQYTITADFSKFSS